MAVIENLTVWNPWWADGTVPEPLRGRPRREAAGIRDDLEGPRAAVLAGIRRAGKTTLMYQVINKLLNEGVEAERILYANLEDSALDEVSLVDLVRAHRQAFSPRAPAYLFFDEVQTRPDWSRFVRVVVDRKRHRIAVTGSTSSLLAGRAGKLLTGRHATTTIRPLDYRGFLDFHGVRVPADPVGPEDADNMVHQMDAYLDRGGFPQPNLEGPERARATLQDYFTDILERDVVVAGRFDAGRVRRVGGYLAKTMARPHTKSSLERATGVSRDAIRTYVEAFESAFLVQACSRFTWSPKPHVAEQAPVKYYLADPALRSTPTGRDRGRLAETAVANALHADHGALQYWRDGRHEVDFVVPRPGGRLDALQVTYGSGVPEREVNALDALWDTLPVSRRGGRMVLTRNIDSDEDGVPHVPVWKWLLGRA